MSILSNSNYQQTVQTINRLRQIMNEQQVHEMQKYEIITIKTKIIQQQIVEAQLETEKHEADCSRKIDQFASETRSKLKEIKQRANEKEIDSDLSKELKELQACKEKLSKMLKNQAQITADKLENEINAVQQSFNYKVKLQRDSFALVQKTLKDEISKLKQKLLRNEFASRSQDIIRMLQQMKTSIDKQIGQLRAKRKDKKQKFLQLFETIIVKCKQGEQ